MFGTHHQDQSRPQLSRAAGLLAAARTVPDIVGILRDHARGIVESDGIAVILRDGDLCHYAAEDAFEPLWRGQRFPMSACVSGWAMLHKQSVIIPDLENDPRVPLESYARTSMRTLAIVPMGVPEPVAALGAYWCAFVEPDDSTIRRLEDLALAATAAFTRVGAAVPESAIAG